MHLNTICEFQMQNIAIFFLNIPGKFMALYNKWIVTHIFEVLISETCSVSNIYFVQNKTKNKKTQVNTY